MSWNNKVLWTEGMFLRPQHFQQQERFIQTWVESRFGNLCCYSWGVTELTIDEPLLLLGKFSVLSGRGVFPDGTPFNIPDIDPSPEPLEIKPDTKNEILYLVLPITPKNSQEVQDNADSDELKRYRLKEIETKDLHSKLENNNAIIQSGELNTLLRLSSQDLDAYVYIPIAKIIECKADKQIIIDNTLIPSCINCKASNQLVNFIEEVTGLLHHKGEYLSKRLGSPGAGGTSEIVEFLLLQIINRHEPLFIHYTSLTQLHPETLFRSLIQLSGELATITKTNHRPQANPLYDHYNLSACFEPVMAKLRENIQWVSETRAVPIPLEKHKHGIQTATINDPHLLRSAEFVLAVSAQIPLTKLQTNFPRQTAIGTIEKLRDLVMSQVPGIVLDPLSVAPRQIPYHKGMTYFQLDKKHELWKQIQKAGSLAIHVSGDYPELELELWAIRG